MYSQSLLAVAVVVVDVRLVTQAVVAVLVVM
jgi:hypothetical protein